MRTGTLAGVSFGRRAWCSELYRYLLYWTTVPDGVLVEAVVVLDGVLEEAVVVVLDGVLEAEVVGMVLWELKY